MKITIAGGSGFLGTALKTYFENKGNQVLILTRNPQKAGEIYWDGKHCGLWCDAIDGSNVLINLTGKSVDCRYTDSNRKEILESRINATNVIHAFLAKAKTKPTIWLNASSATTYIHAETRQMTESGGIIGDDFSMNICKAWEAAFFANAYSETRQVALRTSIVFGQNGGAFPKLRRVTKLGLGGKQGNGRQWVSWIHIEDFCRAVDFCIENNSFTGAVNVTSPCPIRNSEMMKVMRDIYSIPFGLSQPTALLELGSALIGTESELLLKSRNVIPEKLSKAGFDFKFKKLSNALLDIQTN